MIRGGATLSDIDKSFNTELLYWTIGNLITKSFSSFFGENSSSLIILNRGFFDRLAWLETYRILGYMEPEQINTVVKFLLEAPNQSFNTKVILMFTAPEEAIARDHRVKSGESKRRIMNPEFLSILNRGFEKAFEKYSSYFAEFMTIDERINKVSLQNKTEKVLEFL